VRRPETIFAVLSGFLMLVGVVRAQDAAELVRKADAHARGKTSHAEVEIQVVRPGWTREMTLSTWAEGRDKALVRVTAPARDKGTAFLKRGHEVWNWIPSVERTIKLPPSMMSQSWMGTDMTNEDFVKEASIVDDYTAKPAGRDTLLGRPSAIVDLTPKPGAPVVWGRIRMWIGLKDYVELKTEFYDEDGSLVNTLTAEDVAELGGRMLPKRLVMRPADKPGNKTVVIYREMEFDIPIPDSRFSQRGLSESR
jgi:outer membrane lipoprotein-sorting protein